jgi:hypothetical protein
LASPSDAGATATLASARIGPSTAAAAVAAAASTATIIASRTDLEQGEIKALIYLHTLCAIKILFPLFLPLLLLVPGLVCVSLVVGNAKE